MNNNTYEYWLQNATDAPVRNQLLKMRDFQKATAFSGELKFGTAGIRAKMGVGTALLNVYTMRQIAKGTVDYLNEKYSDIKGKTIVIGFDNRQNSWLFAKTCACVFAHFGMQVYLAHECMPTPYLSFAVKKFEAIAGVMITASHNPAEYNGYKLYDSTGCQLADEESKRVEYFISQSHPFEVNPQPFSYYKLNKDIKIYNISSAYLNAVKDVCALKNVLPYKSKEEGIEIVYTALKGTAGKTMRRLFYGISGFYPLPSQIKPDGRFVDLNFPNPEYDQAYNAAVEAAKKMNSDIIIANDPDADRMGVMAKEGEGYKLLTGNQTGVLLLDYLLSKNINYEKPPIIVRSMVSTPMADKIAKKYGAEVIVVPTGFKYIGGIISELEKKGEESRFLFGFEESQGYLCGSHVRDKDGVQAAYLITSLAQQLKDWGKTLFDKLEELYKEFGYYLHKTLSYKFDQEDGNQKIKDILSYLRKEHTIPGIECDEFIDHLYNDSKFRPDMIEIKTDFGSVIVRPSGTEPNIKLYLMAVSDDKDSANKKLNFLEEKCNKFISNYMIDLTN